MTRLATLTLVGRRIGTVRPHLDNKVHILVVDDNRRLRQSIRSLLAGETSLTICAEACDCSTAIEAAAANLPDVILLDMHLPDVSGCETARLIRKTQPDVSIVLMSADDARVLASVVTKVKVNAWLDKARLATDLVQTIRACSSKK